jgi:hypothetical protein
MKLSISALAAIVAACLSLPALTQAPASYQRHGAAVLQDPHQTPGLTDPVLTKEKLCDPAFHTGTVRNVPQSEKVQACRAYGITAGCPGKGYELDHLISIELGGSNDIKNLWPQPADQTNPLLIGYHSKDVVENRAHRAVCSGQITLEDAQQSIARDWFAFGLKYGWFHAAAKKR